MPEWVRVTARVAWLLWQRGYREEHKMSRLARCVVAIGALGLLGGCAASPGAPHPLVLFPYPHAALPTNTESGAEHHHRVTNVAFRDMRALAEDLDLLFMTDRPTRLTKWHTR